jgi:hypothetical protein
MIWMYDNDSGIAYECYGSVGAENARFLGHKGPYEDVHAAYRARIEQQAAETAALRDRIADLEAERDAARKWVWAARISAKGAARPVQTGGSTHD